MGQPTPFHSSLDLMANSHNNQDFYILVVSHHSSPRALNSTNLMQSCSFTQYVSMYISLEYKSFLYITLISIVIIIYSSLWDILLSWFFEGPTTHLPNKSHAGLLLVNAQPQLGLFLANFAYLKLPWLPFPPWFLSFLFLYILLSFLLWLVGCLVQMSSSPFPPRSHFSFYLYSVPASRAYPCSCLTICCSSFY